jgi:hypothetical protein
MAGHAMRNCGYNASRKWEFRHGEDHDFDGWAHSGFPLRDGCSDSRDTRRKGYADLHE